MYQTKEIPFSFRDIEALPIFVSGDHLNRRYVLRQLRPCTHQIAIEYLWQPLRSKSRGFSTTVRVQRKKEGAGLLPLFNNAAGWMCRSAAYLTPTRKLIEP